MAALILRSAENYISNFLSKLKIELRFYNIQEGFAKPLKKVILPVLMKIGELDSESPIPDIAIKHRLLII